MRRMGPFVVWLFVTGGVLARTAADGPFTVRHADVVSHGATRQELVGNVVVERDGVSVKASRMVYDSAAGVLEAWRDVEVRDPGFRLTCARLTFSMKDDEVVAWGTPTLHQLEKTEGYDFETTLTGVQVRIFVKDRRVQVLEDVVLTRIKAVGATREVELRVRCRSMDALSAAKRSTFKGDVAVVTPAVGASSERALYDQLADKFYLLGAAKAWNFDSAGNKINEIEGDKIVYFTRERRTIVIGNVTANVEPDVKTGDRKIPLQDSPVSRPGEVMADE